MKLALYFAFMAGTQVGLALAAFAANGPMVVVFQGLLAPLFLVLAWQNASRAVRGWSSNA